MAPRTRVLALVLAGGAGGRMQPLTGSRAKPALPYGGVYRLIDFPLSHCVHSRVSDVWVVEQFQPHALNDHLVNGRPWDLDRSYGGLRILPPYQGGGGEGWSEGNADALHRNREVIAEFDPDVLLVTSADHVYRLDFRDLLDAHAAHGAAVTIVTTPVPPHDTPSRFGLVEADGDGRVTGFAYKPEHPTGGVAAAEVFAYDARRLLTTLAALADEHPGDDDGAVLKDFGDALIPRLVDEGAARAFPLDGYWRDVGVVESYWRSHMDLLAAEPPLRLDDPAWPIRTFGPQRTGARIARSAEVDESLVAGGCDVRGRVARSVLGPGVVVEEGAEVEGAVLYHDVVVRRGARVTGAVLDSEVEVGDGAVVGSGRAPDPARVTADDLAVVGRAVTLARDSVTAPGARVPPSDAPRRTTPERKGGR